MDGFDAIDVVYLHIVDTHTLFLVALKKMQALAVTVEVIVFFLIDYDDHLVCVYTEILVPYIVRMFIIDRFLRYFRIGYGLQMLLYVILGYCQRIHCHQFLRFLKAWKNRYAVLDRIFGRIGL